MDHSYQPPNSFVEGLNLSKNAILDRFIQASCVFGVIYTSITLVRDISVLMVSGNSVVNLIATFIPAILWFGRKRWSYQTKALSLFASYLLIGIKSIYLFGTYSNSAIIFLCFCCIILSVSMNLKWSVVFMVVLSLIIPIRGYLHLRGLYPTPVTSFQIMSDNPLSWVQLYITFLLTGAILTVGVGRLRQEIYKYIQMLQYSILDLESANVQLQKEITLKTSYQDSLLISSRKFETLFQGSRDGVLLLNDKGQVIEANLAFCEITGYSLDELRQASSIFELMDAPHRELLLKRFDRAIKGESIPMLTDPQLIWRNGKAIPIEINSNLIVGEDEVLLMSTIRDISFRKQAENEKFNAALEAEERERERFSKDLHDDLGPVFSTLKLYLQTLSNKETDNTKRKVLNDLSEMVDSAVKQVREISHNLSPYLLRDAGLIEAIRRHLKRFDDSGSLKTTLEIQSSETNRFHANVEIVLYRIFLELLNNTIKHSGATQVKIHIAQTSNEVTFDYIDNGKGFNPSQQTEKTGIGLKNIENRVRAMGGSVNYNFVAEQMTVQITIPL